jgi:uncharacterized RDD family membrane protein YckC
MRCPSCGAISENPDNCAACGEEITIVNEPSQTETHPSLELKMNPAGEVPGPRKSTLIEFPGVSRNNLPEWRKELSERVREVQERRAREAAEVEQQQVDLATTSPPQLELLPPAEMPAVNPLVAAALRRIERAHKTAGADKRQPIASAATAVAYAPDQEETYPIEIVPLVETAQIDFEPDIDAEIELEQPIIEKSHGLVVVPAIEVITAKPEPEPAPVPQVITPKAEPAPVPKRLIVDDPNDPALNYLDSISRDIRVDEIANNRPSAVRRLISGVGDLIICALLSSPIALAMKLTGSNLVEFRTLAVLVGCVVIVMFLYFTLTTALTGRTWAMRLLSLRVIDRKTGLIPTGGQSVARSFLYIISLATAGLGILFALVSREGYTVHDQCTRTAVVTV